jgi:transcriptional regulator with XRE-family HTH domain
LVLRIWNIFATICINLGGFMEQIPDELRKTARSLVYERERLGLSQKQVAQRMGVSQSKVCRLEGSADANLVYGDVAAYAKALGLNVTLFYDDVDAEPRIRAQIYAEHIADMLEKLKKVLPSGIGYEMEIAQFSGNVLLPLLRNGRAR